MQKIYKATLVLMFVSFVLPSIALASWWNPFSWNWTALFSAPVQTENIQIATSTATTTIVVSKKQKDLPVVGNKRVETNSYTNPVNTPIINYSVATTVTPVVVPVSVKTSSQICKDAYGDNATWDGITYGSEGPRCTCEVGFVTSSDGKSCVARVSKTGYQVCSEEFPNETWDGTYGSNGKYNCICNTGYQWNSNTSSCQLYQQQSAYSTTNNVACQTAKQNLLTFQQQNPYMMSAQSNPNVAADVATGRSKLMAQTFYAQESVLEQDIQIACQ